jgi:hypothetical protein
MPADKQIFWSAVNSWRVNFRYVESGAYPAAWMLYPAASIAAA